MAAHARVLTEPDQWQRWSESGIQGTRKHYSWSNHADRYLRDLDDILQHAATPVLVERPRARRLPEFDRLILTDLDNTLTGDPEALDEFNEMIREHEHIGFGIAMYGSGWYYPPYYGYGSYHGYAYYPYYYPYPYSYGASAWYNPNTGMYGRSGSYYGPYGGYGRGSAYNPSTGTYARGEAVWDSNEIAGRGVAYNPRTGTGVATHRYANEDGGWGESLITQNDKWMETRSEWSGNSMTTDIRTSEGTTGQLTRERSGDAITGTGEFQRGDQTLSTQSYRGSEGSAVQYETGSGQTGGFARSSEGDLYAGSNGEVYKRDENGWQQHGDDGWNPVEAPADRAAQMDQARSDASERRSGFENRDTSGLSERRQSTDAWANRDFDSARNRGSYDTSRRSQLDRSHNARTNGYNRYNQRRSANRSFQNRSRGGRMGGRRRR